MSVDHPPQEDFALYVMGALEPKESERLEGHVRQCARCADLLAEEARLEMKLQALVPRIDERSARGLRQSGCAPLPSLPGPVPPSQRRAFIAPLLLLIAASLALTFGLGRLITAPPAGRLSDSRSRPPQQVSSALFSEELRGSESLSTSYIEPRTIMCQREAASLCRVDVAQGFRPAEAAPACSAYPDADFDEETLFTPVSATCFEPR
jgi:hypothetical protein